GAERRGEVREQARLRLAGPAAEQPFDVAVEIDRLELRLGSPDVAGYADLAAHPAGLLVVVVDAVDVDPHLAVQGGVGARHRALVAAVRDGVRAVAAGAVLR